MQWVHGAGALSDPVQKPGCRKWGRRTGYESCLILAVSGSLCAGRGPSQGHGGY